MGLVILIDFIALGMCKTVSGGLSKDMVLFGYENFLGAAVWEIQGLGLGV